MLNQERFLSLLLLAAVLPTASAQELVVSVESPAFRLDSQLATGPGLSPLVTTVESSIFVLDTRLSVGNDASVLVVSATSSAFTLNTGLIGPLEALIVPAVSPPFQLNTMWIGIRNTASMQLELYWSTNAPGFHPQWAAPPIRPSIQWQDMTNSVSESGGLFRVQLNPEGNARYFRLKL